MLSYEELDMLQYSVSAYIDKAEHNVRYAQMNTDHFTDEFRAYWESEAEKAKALHKKLSDLLLVAPLIYPTNKE